MQKSKQNRNILNIIVWNPMAGDKQFGIFIVSYREFRHHGSLESSKTRPVRYLYEKRKRVSIV